MKRDYEALRQLRRVVENAPEHLFHMRKLKDVAMCGTAYCAFGWASVDPWFVEHKPEIPRSIDADGLGPTFVEVGSEAFGISQRQANDLFAGNISQYGDPHSVSKAEVLWNIDQLIAGKGTRPYATAAYDNGDEGARTVPIPAD